MKTTGVPKPLTRHARAKGLIGLLVAVAMVGLATAWWVPQRPSASRAAAEAAAPVVRESIVEAKAGQPPRTLLRCTVDGVVHYTDDGSVCGGRPARALTLVR